MQVGFFNEIDIENIIQKRFQDVVTLNGINNVAFGTIGTRPELSSSQFEMVWNVDTEIEILQTDNTIDSISSSNVADIGPMFINGCTIQNGVLTSVQQVVILSGQNQVPLPTPLARVETMSAVGSLDLIGDVFVYRDSSITNGVPNDPTTIHLIANGSNSSGGISDNIGSKAAFSTSSIEYIVISEVSGYISRQQNTFVDFKLQIAPVGGVFGTRFVWSANSNGTNGPISLPPNIIIPPNHDVRIIGLASNDAITVGGGLSGVRAVKIDALGTVI